MNYLSLMKDELVLLFICLASTVAILFGSSWLFHKVLNTWASFPVFMCGFAGIALGVLASIGAIVTLSGKWEKLTKEDRNR